MHPELVPVQDARRCQQLVVIGWISAVMQGARQQTLFLGLFSVAWFSAASPRPSSHRSVMSRVQRGSVFLCIVAVGCWGFSYIGLSLTQIQLCRLVLLPCKELEMHFKLEPVSRRGNSYFEFLGCEITGKMLVWFKGQRTTRGKCSQVCKEAF